MAQQQSLPTQECILSKKSLPVIHRRRALTEMDVRRYFQQPNITPLDLTIFRHSTLFRLPQFSQFYQCLTSWNERIKTVNKQQYLSQLQIKAHHKIYEQLRRVQFIPQDKVAEQLDKLMNVSVIRKIMLNNIQQQPEMPYPRTSIKKLSNSFKYSDKANSIINNNWNNFQHKISSSYGKNRVKARSEIKDLCSHYKAEAKNLNTHIEERQIKQQINQIFKYKARFMAMRIKMRRTECINLTPLKINREKIDNAEEEQHKKHIYSVASSTPKSSTRSKKKSKQNIQSLEGISLLTNRYQNKVVKPNLKTQLKIKPLLRL